MFDIGFSELLIFAVMALIILGPDKLPQAVRSAGRWYAKIRYTVTNIQNQIETEFDITETRRQMQEELDKIKVIESNMQKELDMIRSNTDNSLAHLNPSEYIDSDSSELENLSQKNLENNINIGHNDQLIDSQPSQVIVNTMNNNSKENSADITKESAPRVDLSKNSE